MSRESLVPSSSASAKAQPPPPGPPFAAAAKATNEPSSLLLAPHAACVSVDASATHEAEPSPAAVTVDDEALRCTKANAVRKDLLAFYEDTKQTQHVSEMTLRIDTELELLRQQCFAERNARWQFATPEVYTFVPRADWIWHPPTLITRRGVNGIFGRDDVGLLSTERDEHKESTMTMASHAGGSFGKTSKDTPRGEFARDRPWPPREFALKPAIKPTRGRGGKRKAAIVVTEEEPIVAKMCSACHTQSTSLWRTRLVPVENAKLSGSNGVPSSIVPAAAMTIVANGLVAPTDAPAAVPGTPAMQKEVLCMTCYLKLERMDLFERKRDEKKRREREEKERDAAAALQEKKRLQQQVQMLRKQQQQQKRKLAQVHAAPDVIATETAPVFSVVETHALENGESHESRRSKAAADSKKDKKKGRKDKKKKKKKRRHADELDDSESDCLTPMPSPSQMDGKYEYADLAPLSSRSASSTGSFNHELPQEEITSLPELPVQQQSVHVEVSTSRSSSSKRSRDLSRTSSSKRRKNSSASVGPTTSSPKGTQTSSSARAARVKAVPVPAPPTATLVVVPSANKKRARTKKETARERELRAKGQYCPVCNAVYEDDDESSFVCCDSCEMWVHAACDPSLTPELIASLGSSNEKYICPLCAGR